MKPSEIRDASERTRRHFDSAILTPADGDRILDLILSVLDLVEDLERRRDEQPERSEAD